MAEPEKQAADGPSWVKVGGGAHDRTLEENWLFRVRKERFQSRHSGKTHDFYVIHLADAVHVVALTPDDEVLLVRQFRAGSGRDSLEIPGGLVDPGEDPCAAGARELLEETGYAGDPPEFLGTLWSNPSLTTSRISTIVIRNARPVAEPDPRRQRGADDRARPSLGDPPADPRRADRPRPRRRGAALVAGARRVERVTLTGTRGRYRLDAWLTATSGFLAAWRAITAKAVPALAM